MDPDSLDTDDAGLIEFLKRNKDDFDLSKLVKSHELYNTSNKEVLGKSKIENTPVLMLDSFLSLQSKSYSFSYPNTQKAKQKGIHEALECKDYIRCLFNSEKKNIFHNPPVFQKINVGRDDIRSLMKACTEKEGLLSQPRKMLFFSYSLENGTLRTPRLLIYLSLGFVCKKNFSIFSVYP